MKDKQSILRKIEESSWSTRSNEAKLAKLEMLIDIRDILSGIERKLGFLNILEGKKLDEMKFKKFPGVR